MNSMFQPTALGLPSAPIPYFKKSSNQIKPEAFEPSFGIIAPFITKENKEVYEKLNQLLPYVPHIERVQVRGSINIREGEGLKTVEKKNILFQGVGPLVGLAILIGLRNQTLKLSKAEGFTVILNNKKYKLRFTSMLWRS